MIKVKLTSSGKVPVSSSAGIILFAPHHIIIPAGSMLPVNTGTSIHFGSYYTGSVFYNEGRLTDQYYGRITNVNSMLKNKVFVTESFVDDSEEIIVWLVNMSGDSVSIAETTEIAQVIFNKKSQFSVTEEDPVTVANEPAVLPIDTFQWPAPLLHRLPQSN